MKKILLYLPTHAIVAYWVYLSTLSAEINFLLFARIAGLFALLDYVFGLLFSIRHPALERFMAYDKRVVEHRFLQLIATIFAMLHYIFLLLHYVQVPSVLRMYTLPSTPGFVLGILALLAFIFMVASAVIEFLPYSLWRLLHILGAVFSVTAILHVLLVESTYTELFYLKWLVYLLSLVGVVSLVLTWFFRMYFKTRYLYKVTAKKLLGEDITYLTLSPVKHKLRYKGGQFAFFSFKSKNLERSPHPFTIVNPPSESGNIDIAVKALGDFTRKLRDIKVGTLVEIDGPYGNFYRTSKNAQKEVWIGAGIGIAPFLALPINKPTVLYYLTYSEKDAYFLSILKKRARNSRLFEIIHYKSEDNGRFKPEILAKYLRDKGTVFRVCGPSKLLDSIYDYLLLNNASGRLIYEEFNFKG